MLFLCLDYGQEGALPELEVLTQIPKPQPPSMGHLKQLCPPQLSLDLILGIIWGCSSHGQMVLQERHLQSPLQVSQLFLTIGINWIYRWTGLRVYW
jgi:hypothetical protein